jgi:hypothetical protein
MQLIKTNPKWRERFWVLISREPELYTKLIEPLGHEAEAKNREFKESYGNLVNRLTKEFLQDFCKESGEIDWDKLVRFNSATTEPLKVK